MKNEQIITIDRKQLKGFEGVECGELKILKYTSGLITIDFDNPSIGMTIKCCDTIEQAQRYFDGINTKDDLKKWI